MARQNDTDLLLLEDSGSEQRQYLTFRLGDESYALSLLSVKEIIEYGGVTAVPLMPAFVRGVINLRGRVVPVIDLALRFGQAAAPISRRTCIVIVESGEEAERQDVGVVVDSVSQVVEIPSSDIEPGPSLGTRLRADFIAGMGKLDGDFVIMLDIHRILSADEIAALTQSTGGA